LGTTISRVANYYHMSEQPQQKNQFLFLDTEKAILKT
jgi:hypothetical protein